jgi:hypothetical protein
VQVGKVRDGVRLGDVCKTCSYREQLPPELVLSLKMHERWGCKIFYFFYMRILHFGAFLALRTLVSIGAHKLAPTRATT